jgi:predicted dehydrogenase
VAVAGAGLPLLNSCASFARKGFAPNKPAPADGIVNHASIGVGGMMGFNDVVSFTRDENLKLVAVAEVDDRQLAKVKERCPDVRVYKDWRVMLEKEHMNLHSINVCTPDHMHAAIAVTAMNLGLAVYGQKPMAQTLYETRRMGEIAKERGLVTQMGTQLTSSTYERLAVKMIQDGVIGKVKEVFIFSDKTWGDPEPIPEGNDPVPAEFDWDLWCGVAPKPPYLKGYYHPYNWRKRLDYGTGTLGDMGCHIYSPMFAAMSLKAPISVKSIGGVPNKTNWAVDEKFEYVFPGNAYTAGDTIKVTWTDGSLLPPQEFIDMFGEKMPKQGGIFVGTEGILLAPHAGLPVPYPRDNYKEFHYPKLKARNHYGDFIAAVRGEEVKPLADFYEYGGPLTETVLLGALSSRFPNKELKWDAKKLRFTNCDEANAFVKRTYRAGWEVEGLS